ncbi:single-stranded DNA-binding protein [uncultured Clostridium sp.]|uniref:single-stranded DNA-binding protein n=1 Tax=uncultured Clostridium sp. TaxID=59620 RepID=UPI002604150C|nr:single-stranded DNA-binding protein [uncultured Clostridium sp.]
MNKVILTGYLTNDLELKYSKDKNIPFTKGSIAVNDRIKDTTHFIPFVIFNRNAEVMCEHTKKGSHIGLFGRIDRSPYFDEENDKTVYTTTVLADSFEFINSTKKKNSEQIPEDAELISSENLPF